MQIRSGSIDYIPFQKALVLEGLQEDEELKQELEQLQKSVNETFNTLSHRFDTLQVSLEGTISIMVIIHIVLIFLLQSLMQLRDQN